MKLFCKTGLAIMSLLLVAGILMKSFGKEYVATIANSEKKLPIYCVDRNDNKIALSFDAAWGDVK